jgi:hypothetical protein
MLEDIGKLGYIGLWEDERNFEIYYKSSQESRNV